MLRFVLISLSALSACLANTQSPLNLVTLTPAEADAIIAAEEQAKKERKAARLAELDDASVLSEGQGTLPDGRKVIVREVVPPEPVGASLVSDHEHRRMAEPESGAVATITPSVTAEQQAWVDQQAQLQTHKVLMLSCTVYDRSVAEVRWKFEGEDYLAYINANLSILPGILTVSTDADRYDYFLTISNTESGLLQQPLPSLPDFSNENSQYVLVEGDPAKAEATAGLEALLEYYDANLAELKVQHQRSEALSAARKRYKEANPEEKEDYLLQFWVPKKEAPR